MIISAESSGTQSTSSSAWTAIPGLAITLPQGAATTALLILNVPNPYATGTNVPGGNFALEVNGKLLNVIASFTYNEEAPSSTGRVPTTLSVAVPLLPTGQSSVVAVWSNVRGSTVIIDTPATLSAVI